MNRNAEIKRKTKETDITVNLGLDGGGLSEIETPIGFFSHMLESLARFGAFNLSLSARGDIHVDQHHLVEDCGIVLGQAFDQALGSRTGIFRSGFFMMPMDEALALAAVDFGGRGFLQYEAVFAQPMCGGLETGLMEDFLRAFSSAARANIVVRIPFGRSDHHKMEAAFKALGRALRMACAPDSAMEGALPTTKGVI